MQVLLTAMFPEILLATTACLLFLLGMSSTVFARKLAGDIALAVLVVVFVVQCFRTGPNADPVSSGVHASTLIDTGAAIHVGALTQFVKLITAGVGILLVLLNMPTNREGTGGSSIDTGNDTPEFFGLMLLSLAGLCVVASANDLILLFLGIELASIPTYIMVSMSRPLPVAQEAGLKYFFLGAMSAAIMLFGFSYLYGTTGSTSLDAITASFTHFVPSTASNGVSTLVAKPMPFTQWHLLAVLMLIAGFAFKMAAVPLHTYAGDVYQGAATPVTAFLSFVPKTSGFIALIKVLYAVGGGTWTVPVPVVDTLWWMAALTMTFGNVLGLLQFNIKRTLAYSSVAHTGYMLVGVTALLSIGHIHGGVVNASQAQSHALQGVLFYLAAYGITNVAAFGVLQLLPSRHDRPATSAETFEDIAGQGRKHIGLGLAMAVACFSLTGIPLTVGFLGKIYLTQTAVHSDSLVHLSVVLWINAAISAGYYLRIVAALFLRPEPTHLVTGGANRSFERLVHPPTVVIAVLVSVVLTLVLGTVFPLTAKLTSRVERAADMDYETQPMVEDSAATTATVSVPVAKAE